MGAGRSQEAEWPLAGDIPAGEWHLAADCFVIEPVDTRFEIVWRTVAGADTPIVTWERHFEPGAAINQAQTHDFRAQGPAVVGTATGDQLIFRYTGLTGAQPMAWIPNGDGELAMGRIPYIELP